jgi:hypothetical protein
MRLACRTSTTDDQGFAGPGMMKSATSTFSEGADAGHEGGASVAGDAGGSFASSSEAGGRRVTAASLPRREHRAGMARAYPSRARGII